MTTANDLKKIAKNGLLTSNPTFRLVLGTCPTLAVTTSLISGLAMGLATTFVLLFSNIIISALRKVIPDKVRIPAYIVIIATFVTLIEMVMSKFLPDLYETLGVFISLIVVNCIIFARAESFASQNPVLASAVSVFLETPRKGQIPRNLDSTKLLTRTEVTSRKTYCI